MCTNEPGHTDADGHCLDGSIPPGCSTNCTYWSLHRHATTSASFSISGRRTMLAKNGTVSHWPSHQTSHSRCGNRRWTGCSGVSVMCRRTHDQTLRYRQRCGCCRRYLRKLQMIGQALELLLTSYRSYEGPKRRGFHSRPGTTACTTRGNAMNVHSLCITTLLLNGFSAQLFQDGGVAHFGFKSARSR